MSTPDFNDDVPAVPSSDFHAGTWQMGAGGASAQALGATDVSVCVPKRPDLAYPTGSVLAHYTGATGTSAGGEDHHWFCLGTEVTPGFDFVVPCEGWFRNIMQSYNFYRGNGGGVITRLSVEGFGTELAASLVAPNLVLPTVVLNEDWAEYVPEGEVCGISSNSTGRNVNTADPTIDMAAVFSIEFASLTGHSITGNGSINPTPGAGAGATVIGSIGYGFIGDSYAALGDADVYEIAAPFDMTIDRLYVVHNGTQGADGSLTYTLYVSDSDTPLVVTVPALGVPGIYSNTTDAVNVGKGARIFVAIKNNHTATVSTARSFSMRVKEFPDTGVFRQLIAGRLTGGTNVGTSFYGLPFQTFNKSSGSNDIREAQVPWSATGVLRNFFIYGGLANASFPVVATICINGGGTSVTVTMTSTTEQWWSDTLHSVPIAKGDLVSIELAFGSSTFGANLGGFSFEFAAS